MNLSTIVSNSPTENVEQWLQSDPTRQAVVDMVTALFGDANLAHVPVARNRAKIFGAFLISDLSQRGVETVLRDKDVLDVVCLKTSEIVDEFDGHSDAISLIEILIPNKTVPVAPKQGRGRRVDPNSPMQRSHNVYKQMEGQDRKSIIQAFVDIGVAPRTATAYFYICRNKARKGNKNESN